MRPFIRFLLLSLLLAGCATSVVPQKKAQLVLKPSSFDALSGWQLDDQAVSLNAFRRSCDAILKQAPAVRFDTLTGLGGTYGDWQPACRYAIALLPQMGREEARAFFEKWFTPWQATADGEENWLFTGYYEASLHGSRTKHGPFQYPLRARPDDLVTVNLGEFRPELKGQRIAGRVVAGALKPYDDNRAITTGKLPPAVDKPLVWVDDPVDAFFLQIQGSGIVELDDGSLMRVGYAAQNGHTYYAVGRELVKRGELPQDQVSMQSIRAWMKAHPDQAQELMFTNPSYVFFREPNSECPLGGVRRPAHPGPLARYRPLRHALRPARLDRYGSAHDRRAAPAPPDGVLQDTGGAITGPVRGDFFWGHGRDAEMLAGQMKSQGRMWLRFCRKR